MGRDIRFRAYDKKYKKMTYLDSKSKCSYLMGLYETGDFEVMQFTGLKDKNGIDIFEGDILGDVWEPAHIEWCDKCKQFQLHLTMCDYGPCQACEGDVHWSEIVYESSVPNGRIEVIGNRFENPELLELAKKAGLVK